MIYCTRPVAFGLTAFAHRVTGLAHRDVVRIDLVISCAVDDGPNTAICTPREAA
jgi:hypothetical protein